MFIIVFEGVFFVYMLYFINFVVLVGVWGGSEFWNWDKGFKRFLRLVDLMFLFLRWRLGVREGKEFV